VNFFHIVNEKKVATFGTWKKIEDFAIRFEGKIEQFCFLITTANIDTVWENTDLIRQREWLNF
jgi:hypothetical protein